MTVTKTARVYEVIERKAGSNEAMQGLSGMMGFPFTLMADTAVIFTHYEPMVNEIRSIYGRDFITKDKLVPVIKGAGSEILSDLVLDKVVGQIPIIGIASNIMCAKAMTWRIGLLFAILSARGEEITSESVKKTCVLIRTLFPQKNTFMFKKPSIVIAEKLLNSFENNELSDYEAKIDKILDGILA